MTDTPNDSGSVDGELQPWLAASVPEDALDEDLPAEVAAAARRAIRARRSGVTVAQLRHRHVESDGTAVYSFRTDADELELRVSHGEGRSRLHISSAAGRAGQAEVLHGPKPTQLVLDEAGSGSLDVEDGLVSVVLSYVSCDRAPVQTSWIRIP